MSESPQILQKMDAEAIRWQRCAICDAQTVRVVHQTSRPDYALCDNCQAAFILEDGGKLRMYFGNIPETMPQTRAFALKQWHPYADVRLKASEERREQQKRLAAHEAASRPIIGGFGDNLEALLDLEREQSEMLYDRARKIEPPPRVLRETGELPNLDELFAQDD